MTMGRNNQRVTDECGLRKKQFSPFRNLRAAGTSCMPVVHGTVISYCNRSAYAILLERTLGYSVGPLLQDKLGVRTHAC